MKNRNLYPGVSTIVSFLQLAMAKAASKDDAAKVMRKVLDVKRRVYTPNEVSLHNCAEV